MTKEVKFAEETLAFKVYRVLGVGGEELAVRIPKRLPETSYAILDLVFSTHLIQVLKDLEEDINHFFPLVKEEIFFVDKVGKRVLNYISIVEFPRKSVASMVQGPLTGKK